MTKLTGWAPRPQKQRCGDYRPDDGGCKMSEWISVEERLPDDGVPVLICNSFGEIYTCRRPVIVGINKTWEDNTGEFIRPRVTHWMPLPPPPEAGK